MRKYTRLSTYKEKDDIIIWFWEIMEEFDDFAKASFIFFLSGPFFL